MWKGNKVKVSGHCTANTGHRYTEMLMILFFPPFTFTFTFICFECGKEDQMWKGNKVKVSGHCTANNTGHRFTEILMILFLSTFYFHFLSSALKVEKKKTVKVELCFFSYFLLLSLSFIHTVRESEKEDKSKMKKEWKWNSTTNGLLQRCRLQMMLMILFDQERRYM